MNTRYAILGGLLATLMALPVLSHAIEVKVTRKIADVEQLSTQTSEQMEVSFTDGAVVVLGSASQAQVRSDGGALSDLALVTGAFEIVTAPDGFLSLRVDQCVADIVSGTLRVNVAQDRVDFVLQSGNAALIRKGSQIAHITKPGFSVATSCADDSAISTPQEPTGEMLAKLQSDLGTTDTLAVKTATTTPDTTTTTTEPITNVKYASLNPTKLLMPSVSPSTIEEPVAVFRLPISISPSVPDSLGDVTETIYPPCCDITTYWWTELPEQPTQPTVVLRPVQPVGPRPIVTNPDNSTDLTSFTPSLIATAFEPSTIYQGGAQDLSDDIRFGIDPVARTAAVLGVPRRETIALPTGARVDTRQIANEVLIRLPVSNPADTYVTFTYRHVRYALLAGTHSATGDLITDPSDMSFLLNAYETFRLTPGTAQNMTGTVNGLAIDQAAGTYVTLGATDFQITPSGPATRSSSLAPFGIGISGRLDLTANGSALASVDLFGSARDDSSHYFDLAAQNGNGATVALASGERVPGLNVPASVQKYGSYLDWGILRGAITTASGSVDALPTPWVAGREWSVRDLDGFNGTARYQGHVLGNAVDNTGARTSFGTYDNSWDFQTGTGTVQMNFDGTSYAGQTTRTAGTISFTGDIASGSRTGSLTGKFYGNSTPGVAPDAVGGGFSVRGSGSDDYAAEGIFAGAKQ